MIVSAGLKLPKTENYQPSGIQRARGQQNCVSSIHLPSTCFLQSKGTIRHFSSIQNKWNSFKRNNLSRFSHYPPVTDDNENPTVRGRNGDVKIYRSSQLLLNDQHIKVQGLS